MTITEAVEILNRRKHRNSSWSIPRYKRPQEPDFVCGDDRYDRLDPFEAVAIAEKYLREEVELRKQITIGHIMLFRAVPVIANGLGADI